MTKLYEITCDEAPPSWPASLLYTLPAKHLDGEASPDHNNLRPLPFVLAALRSAEGLALADPEGPEAANPGEAIEGGDGSSQAADSTPGGVESVGASEGAGGVDGEGDTTESRPPPALDNIEMARKLGPMDGEANLFLYLDLYITNHHGVHDLQFVCLAILQNENKIYPYAYNQAII